MKDVLMYLEQNGRATAQEIAQHLGRDEAEVSAIIKKCEDEKIILGYKTIVDWRSTEENRVSAQIEIKIIPQRGDGFARVAERICAYDEVESVTLMSGGGYDLLVRISGKSLEEVAMFVAEKVAPLDCVTSTATLFELKKFKDSGEQIGKTTVADQERLTRL